MYIKQKIQDLKCEPHLSIYDSALSLVAVNSYDRMTNTLYFCLLPFSPASNNIYHLLLQTTSKGCFTPSVITSVFNLAPSEEDGKLYAEASLLEMGTGIQRLSRKVQGWEGPFWGYEGQRGHTSPSPLPGAGTITGHGEQSCLRNLLCSRKATLPAAGRWGVSKRGP